MTVLDRHALTRGFTMLARALESETRLVQELRRSLAGQRDAVSREDNDRLSATVSQITRILQALEAARRTRGELVGTITGDPETPLAELESRMASPLPEDLTRARSALGREARDAAIEAAVNREVLDRVIQTGDAFLQRLFSAAGGENPVYHATAEETTAAAGLLLNRTV